MAKPVQLKFNDGRIFTLDYNRDSVRFGEENGIGLKTLGQFNDLPMNTVLKLFWLGFHWHHPNVTIEEADKILFDDLGGVPEGLLERLVELYTVPYESIIGKSEAKNVVAVAIL